MTDRRTVPANGRVAAAHLRGQVEAERYERGEPRAVRVPVADLLRVPGGRRERQVLAGQAVTVYDECGGFAFVQVKADGYVGYLPRDSLQPSIAATHRVSVRGSHAYTRADFKSHELEALSFGSLLQVSGEEGQFLETLRGFVPRQHLAPIDLPAVDPVRQAELFLGTPYLWGGNSGGGIDCSGLVQVACAACGIACPGDSDLQEAALGRALRDDEELQRGDVVFWDGHVAWVADAKTLLHANVHHMAVVYEGLDAAIARIEAQGSPVTTRKRLVG